MLSVSTTLGFASASDWLLPRPQMRRRLSVPLSVKTASELRKYSVPPPLHSNSLAGDVRRPDGEPGVALEQVIDRVEAEPR